MANAVHSLKIREEGIRLGSRNVRSRLATVGGNKVVFLRKMLKKSRDIGASTLLQSLEDTGLVFTASGSFVPPELLMDVSLEVDTDLGAYAILQVLHVELVNSQ